MSDDPKIAVEKAGIGATCVEKDVKSCPVWDTNPEATSMSTCKGTSPGLGACTGKAITFDTRALCTSTGLFVEKNAQYQLLVSKATKAPSDPNVKTGLPDWRFAGAASDFGGLTLARLGRYDGTSCGDPGSWEWVKSREWLKYGVTPFRLTCSYLAARGRQVFGMFAFFLKRSLDRPLGTFILRYGQTGNEENFIDADAPPDTAEHLDEVFMPTRDGELYVYLNKPALGVWPSVAYELNSGFAKVTVIRIPKKS